MKTDNYLITVSLFLRGDDLDPASISKKIGITPTSSQYKGEKRVTSTLHEYVAKIGVWELLADSSSTEISEHIIQLMSRLRNCDIKFDEIEGVQEAYVYVFIAGYTNEDGDGTCEFELSKKDIDSLGELGLSVRFTITLGRE